MVVRRPSGEGEEAPGAGAQGSVAAYVAVVGSAECDARTAELAEEVGERLARLGVTLVCGGLGGVMEAACRGAAGAGGTTIGLLPGAGREEGNPYLTGAIATGMGEMRNALVVRAADALIAVSGGFGTLSEVAFALKTGVPVVSLGSWDLDAEAPGAIGIARSAEQAVALALEAAASRGAEA